MIKAAEKMVQDQTGKANEGQDWIEWVPSHCAILAQAMEKAGTVDDNEAILKQIRGGTFSTPAGTFTMSGAKTYGSPIVFGAASGLGQIKNNKTVYFSEMPWQDLP
jgi:hypothetical protein